MSEEHLKAFWKAVQADAGLQEKLNAAADADSVVSIAKAAGFVISVKALKKAQVELSEEELGGVAGGTEDGVRGVVGLGWVANPFKGFSPYGGTHAGETRT